MARNNDIVFVAVVVVFFIVSFYLWEIFGRMTKWIAPKTITDVEYLYDENSPNKLTAQPSPTF